MTFENGTFYKIELPRMCPQSEIRNLIFNADLAKEVIPKPLSSKIFAKPHVGWPGPPIRQLFGVLGNCSGKQEHTISILTSLVSLLLVHAHSPPLHHCWIYQKIWHLFYSHCILFMYSLTRLLPSLSLFVLCYSNGDKPWLSRLDSGLHNNVKTDHRSMSCLWLWLSL